MSFKKIINQIHLWMGLISGLIIIIISITGCIYAFKTEIESITQSYRHVTVEKKEQLPPSVLSQLAVKQLPGKMPHSVEYGTPDKAAQVTFYHDDPGYYYIVFVNPYSGEVLKVQNMDREFFRIVLAGHFYLWLPDQIGQPLVASATLVFVLMLITGIVLWWPKNKSAAKQRFTIMWSARWRRKNYDLHNVLGFYACWIAIFLAITGLVWGFEWFAKGLYWTTSGGETAVQYYETFSDTTGPMIKPETPAVDILWKKLRAENPTAEAIEVHIPETPASSIAASSNPDASTYWQASHQYFDQYTLKETEVKHPYGKYRSDMPLADKILRMNYDIHVGAIVGLPGKFLAFFASLICASLPVTGFIIWWGRRNKKK